ncbi:MAG TPA: hypothetical protein VEB59_14250 [Gemmatimonadales bacterium]|nr:hypothetical protein [Gemmatimonadales bacterium]
MSPTLLPRLIVWRRRAAIALLVLIAIAYPIAWDADLYIFGILVLIAAPVQFALAGAGILARLLRLEPITGALAWAVDAMLIAFAAGALAFLRTVSWS